MDGSYVYQTDVPSRLETEDGRDDMNNTAIVISSWDALNGLEASWSPRLIFRVSVLSLLMLLTLIANAIVIITLSSSKHVYKLNCRLTNKL